MESLGRRVSVVTEADKERLLEARVPANIAELGCPFNICSGQAFNRANRLLDGVLKENKREGKESQVQRKSPLSDDDRQRLAEFFADVLNHANPVKFSMFVWYAVTCIWV